MGFGRMATPVEKIKPAFLVFSTKSGYRPLGYDRRLGGAQPGNRFVSFVRAYARSGCLVELDLKSCGPGFSLFPLASG